MTDSAAGSSQIQKSQNGDKAKLRSSQEVTGNTKETCVSTVFWVISYLEGVPKIALIQITKLFAKNNFLNTFGQKDVLFEVGLQ